jgi:hypothetical protein
MREAQGLEWPHEPPHRSTVKTRPHTSFSPVSFTRVHPPMRRRRPGVSRALLLYASPRAAGGVNCEGADD